MGRPRVSADSDRVHRARRPGCRTARDVLDRLARFAAILNNGPKVHIVDDRGLTQCRFEILHTLDNYLVRHPRHALEAMAVGVTTTIGRLTSQSILPVEVAFSYPAPVHTSEHTPPHVPHRRPRHGRAIGESHAPGTV